MKILFINTIAGRTAVGQIIDSIASSAISEGHDVYIAAGYGQSSVKGVINIPIGNTVDRYIHALCTRLNDSHALHSLRATSLLIDNIVKLKPDIIHIHNLHGYYIHMPLLISFLKKTSIPVCLTLHDLWLLTGHCAYPTATKCDKYIDGLCENCNQSRNYPKSYLDFSSRNVEIKKKLFADFHNLYLVTPSRWMSDVVHKSWLKNNPMFIINNGIDVSIFKPCNVEQENMVLGVANVWTKEKGFESFIRLREILPPEIEILLVGIAPSQQKNLSLGIRYLGNVSNRDLPKLYSAARATINLSVNEAFGMTIIESIACATPVISFNNTAPAELITKETGVLIPDGDLFSISEAIKKIKKEDYADNCRNCAAAYYDETMMGRKYLDLFELMQ